MLDLTPAEFRLLKTLSHEPGKVFSREQLLNHLYDDYRVVTDRTIDSHIKTCAASWNLSTPNSHLSAPFTASVTAGKPTPAASFNILPAGGGLQTRSGNIIPRMVSKLTLSLRPAGTRKSLIL